MGDRASAAESGMALGAVAEGLATHQDAIMAIYADIARQCIANRVAYSVNSEFPVNNFGSNSSITIQQMALDAIVDVKPKLARKVQEKMLAANALSLLGSMKDVATPDLMAVLMEQALFGQLPRKMAASLIKAQGASDKEIAIAEQQAQNQAQMLQQNEQAYSANPIPYEVNNAQQQLSQDEMDQLINGLSEPESVEPVENPDALAGLPPETAGELANPSSFGEGEV